MQFGREMHGNREAECYLNCNFEKLHLIVMTYIPSLSPSGHYCTIQKLPRAISSERVQFQVNVRNLKIKLHVI